MKQYVLDQLREEDHAAIGSYLRNHADPSILEGVYWMDIPEDLYTEVQRDHPQCRPFYFAVNLDSTRVSFELLIRSRQILRCSCIGYASPEQREHILSFADRMLDELKIKL